MNRKHKKVSTFGSKNDLPFIVKDCALTALATGKRARTLRGLRDYLESIEPESIYYHFWGALLRPRFEDPEYHNDFASWAAHSLNDRTTAERLGIIDPAAFLSMDALRQELIDVIDERMDELEVLPAASRDKQFEFISSDIVVFSTPKKVHKPAELLTIVPEMSPGSIYYHFIDARRRTNDSLDDFSAWLKGHHNRYVGVISEISDIDPYFSSLTQLREELFEALSKHFEEAA